MIKIAQIGLNTFSHSNEVLHGLKTIKDFELVGYVLPENERERLPHKLYVLDGCKEMTLDEVLNDPEIEAASKPTR